MREPLIIDKGRNIDLRSKLLSERIVMIDTEFSPEMAAIINQQLMYLNSVDQKRPIELIINSPGGCVISGLSIYDTIKSLKCDTHTVGLGLVASMGAFMLVCGGKKGHRKVTPNAQVMFHQISSSTSGNIQDQRIRLEHSDRLNDKLSTMIAKAIGMGVKKYEKAVERDLWLEGKEVVKFGAADGII